MATWSLEFLPDAERDLARLDGAVRRRIIGKLDWFLEHFDSLFPIPLTGDFREFYKLRVSDWRIFYDIDWRKFTIRVVYIERMDKAYKKRR